MTEQVLVIEKDLFSILNEDGFVAETDALANILAKAKFMDRQKAEHDPSHKQIIPYSIIRFRDQAFRYRRSHGGYESRLHGLFSLGVGGHVNPTDLVDMDPPLTRIVERARDRELQEEFDVGPVLEQRLIGLLNDNTNEVGKVHLGVVYEYWLTKPDVISKEPEQVETAGFILVHKMRAQVQGYESWSRIIIKQYFSAGAR